VIAFDSRLIDTGPLFVDDAIAMIDHEGDGDLDILTWHNGFSVSLNDGSENFSTVPFLASDLAPQWLAVRDADSDGDEDLLVRTFDEATEVYGYGWIENSGSGSYEYHQLGDEELVGFEVADLDVDGDLDFVVASADDVRWHENITIAGDFNGDGLWDAVDVDALSEAIALGTGDVASFDLNGDDVLDLDDQELWLQIAGSQNLPSGAAYLLGDANLDGAVDGRDVVVWNRNKFTQTTGWSNGDFDADGLVNGQDFVAWNRNKFQNVAGPIGQRSVQDLGSEGTNQGEDKSEWEVWQDMMFAVLGSD
jgi:hypothetical protein